VPRDWENTFPLYKDRFDTDFDHFCFWFLSVWAYDSVLLAASIIYLPLTSFPGDSCGSPYGGGGGGGRSTSSI